MLQLCLEQPLVTEMFGRFRQSHGWEHNGNRNVNHLIVIGLDGEAVFQLDEEQYHIRRGDMLIVPAETFYTAETRNGFEYDFLHIRPEALRRVSEEEARSALDVPPYPPRNFQLRPTQYDCLFLDILIHLEEWFDRVLFDLTRCRSYMVTATPRDKVLLDLCVAQMLAEVSERCSSRLSPVPPYPELLTRILAWIRQNFAGDATLTTIAGHFQVSKTYVSRLFRTYLSATVTEYVNELRLQYASELLRLSSMNISQIAAGVGFGNVYYFSRLFSRRFGISPTAYRKQGSA